MENGADLPRRIGVYTVERELGAGGMGTVYLARSRGGRAVAVKVARPELAADPHFRERFRAEVEAARRVGGFHTAPVVDADPDAETPWLATAYIPGPTLAELIERQGPMEKEQLRSLGAALAEALQAVHACGLVHRDLKPGNIIMADDGPRVLDFGIARAVESTRLTATGAAFGTPGYLAPEQAQGGEVSGAADVFALGAVLVAAAGGSAFGTGTPMGLMYRSVHEPADLSAVPGELRSLVAACLSKDPAGRPTPEALLRSLGPDPKPGPDPNTLALATPDRPRVAPPVPVETPADPGRVDEPLPRAPAEPSRMPRVIILLIVAAAVTSALVGALLALTRNGDDNKGGGPSGTASDTRRVTSHASAPPSTPTSSSSRVSAAPKDRVTVVVSARSGRSWISAKDHNGHILFDGLLDNGETKNFTDKNQITLILGDASVLQLVVNGKEVPNDFQPGQVERLTYGRSD
ncbi:serine/threonine protein kinase [Streptomyces puniciscabiei]|uniref:Serine/threonine protein kinase n=1 Tax=Streptomyces puniciscabiei TaxID=164348 RepID=A0A542UNS9_9ACTN|nr:RodZ domain-containing protein [Streptomyces puniciscabiei]TQL00718.1 serine/threonine protein kinase [Streptomyces puniciscabiei]